MDTSAIDVAIWGFIGAALAEGVIWHRLRQNKKLPFTKNFSPAYYWAVSFIWMLGGTALVLMHYEDGNTMSAALSVNIGATAPYIIGSLASKVPVVKE